MLYSRYYKFNDGTPEEKTPAAPADTKISEKITETDEKMTENAGNITETPPENTPPAESTEPVEPESPVNNEAGQTEQEAPKTDETKTKTK